MPTEGLDNSLAQLTVGLATGAPVVVASPTGIVWLLTGRALRPVDAMRAHAAEITASDLSRRIYVAPADDALGRPARTFSDLLARLDTATRRQRRFIADAAHELRTPLSTLHTRLEVVVRHPGSADWSALAPGLLRETERLSRLVDDLLQLARLDVRTRLRFRPVDLHEIVFTEVRRARRRTRLVIDQHAVGAARVEGDEDALVHVGIGFHVLGGTARLVVADDGPAIPEADRERVFGRTAPCVSTCRRVRTLCRSQGRCVGCGPVVPVRAGGMRWDVPSERWIRPRGRWPCSPTSYGRCARSRASRTGQWRPRPTTRPRRWPTRLPANGFLPFR
ncbi:histidine kinase dimerization/phospho-acceptor domain-containing protein [Streptomyces sp. NPDC001777]|uniref:histidine kinase dimerization/phospho-acceptor domain-containing protein n=1 Tax=Streptomyces sp. NPDC001777 TaxID=3364608 RepID=UPI0036BFD1EB